MILLQFRCKLLFEPCHLFYICAAACPVYRYIFKLKCELEYVSIKSSAAVTLLLLYHNNNTEAKIMFVS